MDINSAKLVRAYSRIPSAVKTVRSVKDANSRGSDATLREEMLRFFNFKAPSL